jgi:hypothetical protein
MAEDLNQDGSSIPGQVNNLKKLETILSNINVLKDKGVSLDEEEEKLLRDQIKDLEKKLKIEGQLDKLDQAKLKNAKAYLEKQKEINNQLNESLSVSKKLISQFSTLAQTKLGATFDMSSITQKMKQAGGGLSSFNSGIKEMGKQALSAQNTTEMIYTGWKKIFETYQDLDKTAVSFARTTNMTREASWQTLQNFNNLTKQSGELYDTSEKYLKANTAINDQFGIGVVLGKERLSDYSKLANIAQYDEETMRSLVQSSAILGKSSTDIAKQRLGGMKVTQMTYGIQVNERKIMQDIAKLSNSTKISYMGQEVALAKAATQAKIMGTSLEKMEGVAESLMNFESSIEKQMEAELLTGRTLNLERARYYALTNDIGGLMRELNAQNITAENFSNMNRIQQKAIAEAMGMQKDEMAGMLLEQKAILKLGKSNFDLTKAKYLEDVKNLGTAKANLNLGDESLAKQMEQITNAERMKLSQEKMGDSMQNLVQIMESINTSLVKIVQAFSTLTGIIEGIGKAFLYISGFKLIQWLMGGGINTAASQIGNLTKTASGAAQAGTGLTQSAVSSVIPRATSSAFSGIPGAVPASAARLGASVIKPPTTLASSTLTSAGGISTIMPEATGAAAGASESIATQLGKKEGGNRIAKMLGKYFSIGGKGILKRFFANAAIAAPIEAYFANSDIKGMIADPSVSNEMLKQSIGKRTAQGIGGILGGVGASALNVTASAFGIPTWIWSAAIAMGGAKLGSMVFGGLADVFGAEGLGGAILNSLYSKELSQSRGVPELEKGGVVTETGLIKAHAGEVYTGGGTLKMFEGMWQEMKNQNQQLKEQNRYLAAIANKSTVLQLDRQVLATEMGKEVAMSYGNILNPGSQTFS